MTAERPATYADTVLDREFFEELGRFVANCGHLERVLWILLARIARLDIEDEADAARALRSSQKPLGALIEEMQNETDRARHLSVEFRAGVSALLNEISADLVYRNLAIHGAWSSEADHYRVSFFDKARGAARDDVNSYRAFAAPVSLIEIRQSSETATTYLHRTMALMAMT